MDQMRMYVTANIPSTYDGMHLVVSSLALVCKGIVYDKQQWVLWTPVWVSNVGDNYYADVSNSIEDLGGLGGALRFR